MIRAEVKARAGLKARVKTRAEARIGHKVYNEHSQHIKHQ